MKSIFFLSDPLPGVTDYEKVATSRSLMEMETEARSRTLSENQKEYQDINFKLLTLNRWFYFSCFFVGLFWLPGLLLCVYSFTPKMVNFLSVMILVFIVTHFTIYEVPLRGKAFIIKFLKSYRTVLKQVIIDQEGQLG
jgi:hypothetical protein